MYIIKKHPLNKRMFFSEKKLLSDKPADSQYPQILEVITQR